MSIYLSDLRVRKLSDCSNELDDSRITVILESKNALNNKRGKTSYDIIENIDACNTTAILTINLLIIRYIVYIVLHAFVFVRFCFLQETLYVGTEREIN